MSQWINGLHHWDMRTRSLVTAEHFADQLCFPCKKNMTLQYWHYFCMIWLMSIPSYLQFCKMCPCITALYCAYMSIMQTIDVSSAQIISKHGKFTAYNNRTSPHCLIELLRAHSIFRWWRGRSTLWDYWWQNWPGRHWKVRSSL